MFTFNAAYSVPLKPIIKRLTNTNTLLPTYSGSTCRSSRTKYLILPLLPKMFATFEPNSASLGPSPSEGVSQSQRPLVKPSRRRDKPQLSCTICRQKKWQLTINSQKRLSLCWRICRLKCNRVKPCLNCTKRGQPESCDYIKQDSSRSARQQGTTNVYDRVRQLEDMVKKLLNGQTILDQDVHTAEKSPSASSLTDPIKDDGFAQSSAPSLYIQRDSNAPREPSVPRDPNVPKASLGKFTSARNQVSFVGSEHWEAILEDITELKIDLETPDTSEMLDFKPQILFGLNRASRSEIMSSIPPKPVCDMLISRWFRTMDMAPSKFNARAIIQASTEITTVVVHVPTFMKEVSRSSCEPW